MILLLVVIVLVLLLIASWIRLNRESKRFNVRGPSPLPLIGNAHLFIVKSSGEIQHVVFYNYTLCIHIINVDIDIVKWYNKKYSFIIYIIIYIYIDVIKYYYLRLLYVHLHKNGLNKKILNK